MNEALPQEYIDRCNKIAGQQIIIASIRLAMVIENIFGTASATDSGDSGASAAAAAACVPATNSSPRGKAPRRSAKADGEPAVFLDVGEAA